MAISQVITAAPDAPTRNDPTNFPTRADAFVSWQENNPTEINTWATQANSTQASINASEVVAANAVAQTLAYRDAAISAVNGKGSWSTLTGAIAIPAIVYHNSRNWQLLQNLADVTSVEPGTNGSVWFDLTFELVKDLTPQLGGGLDGQWNDVDHIILKQIAETVYPIGTFTGGTYTINLSNSLVQSLTISTAEQTFTFTNPSTTGTNTSFVLYVTNGGSQVVNWPTTVKWPDGETPDLTAAGLDVIVFSTKDAGTNWYGFIAGLDVR